MFVFRSECKPTNKLNTTKIFITTSISASYKFCNLEFIKFRHQYHSRPQLTASISRTYKDGCNYLIIKQVRNETKTGEIMINCK